MVVRRKGVAVAVDVGEEMGMGFGIGTGAVVIRGIGVVCWGIFVVNGSQWGWMMMLCLDEISRWETNKCVLQKINKKMLQSKRDKFRVSY
jgi:hypothetical protein